MVLASKKKQNSGSNQVLSKTQKQEGNLFRLTFSNSGELPAIRRGATTLTQLVPARLKTGSTLVIDVLTCCPLQMNVCQWPTCASSGSRLLCLAFHVRCCVAYPVRKPW